MANENIIREVDEDLRSDRARALWKQYGPYLIGAAVLVVLAVAVNEGWSWWQNTNAARSSDQFYAALALTDGTDVAAAQKALDDVVAQGTGGYPDLARFREAALLAKSGKIDDAAAAYDAIASRQTNLHLREIALVLAAYQLVDKGDVAGVQQRVLGLITPTDPMRNAARETIALAKYKAGDLDGAAQSFGDILGDPAGGQDARSRATVFLAQLISMGAKDPTAVPTPQAPAAEAPATTAAPAPADAPAAPAPAANDNAPAPVAPAAPAVDDSPALDVTPPAATAPSAPAATDATPAPAASAAPAATPAAVPALPATTPAAPATTPAAPADTTTTPAAPAAPTQ